MLHLIQETESESNLVRFLLFFDFEKALRALFKKLRPPLTRRELSAISPKPLLRREVCGFSFFYKGALVR